ncbi:MAG: stage V sporulation protein AE [Oscillospiraceae bacterium]|nr:stage V sporulation protein AE [Oscillospiraceae bacterium]
MEVFGEYLRAFICGGIFCLIGQILIDKTKLTPAKILVIYVVAGVVLGGLGIYKYIVAFGGAGATLPLTGFGYNLAKGVAKAVAEKGIFGALTGGVTAAAAGITAAIFFGYLIALIFKPKSKSM